MTDLEELKTLWLAHDRKLDAALRLNRHLLERSGLARARSALARLRLGLVLEFAANLVALVLLAAYVATRTDTLRFALPGVALWIGAVVAVAGTAGQLAAARVELDEPVVAAQRRLERLRRLRAACVRWTLLLAPLAWTPLAIVALDAGFGVDAWLTPGPAWLAANLGFGVAVLIGGWWMSVRSARWRRSPRLARLADAVSGRSVADATAALRQIGEFEA